MSTGSGLDSQFAVATEATVGQLSDFVSGVHLYSFNDNELTFDPSYIENSGIMSGARFKSINQVGIARKAATGKFEIPVMQNNFGWWFRHILGSTAAAAADGTGGAYKQIHTPGGLRGIAFSAQVVKPEPGTGALKVKNYNGCKITDWDLTFQDNQVTTLDGTIDAWNEIPDSPAAVAATYTPAGNIAYNFANVTSFETIAAGGCSTTSGLTTISAGQSTAVPSVATKFTLSGKASLSTDRYGLGNAGIKKEQLETDFFELTGAFEGEYDAATWDGPFTTGQTIGVHILSTGGVIGTSSSNYMLDILIPAAKITKAPAPVTGPDIVKVSGEFTVYAPDQADNTPPIQIIYESSDATI